MYSDNSFSPRFHLAIQFDEKAYFRFFFFHINWSFLLVKYLAQTTIDTTWAMTMTSLLVFVEEIIVGELVVVLLEWDSKCDSSIINQGLKQS